MNTTKTNLSKTNLATEDQDMIRMLIPLVLEYILTFAICNINTVIINHFSPNAVAATTSVATFVSLMVNGYSIFYAGAGILLAPYWARKNYKDVNLIWTISIANIFLLSLLLGTVGLFGSSFICRLLHVPSELLPMASSYLKTVLIFSLFQGSALAFTTMFRAIGKMKTAMIANVLLNGTCVLLNFLVLVLIPERHQNIILFALAGVISQFIACLFYFLKIYRDPNMEFHILYDEWRKKYRDITHKIFSLGFLGGMEGIIYLIYQTIVLSMIGKLGAEALMIKGYSDNLINYLTLPSTVFALLTSTMIGMAMGVGDEARAHRCLKKSLIRSVAATAVLDVIFLLFGKFFIGLYTSDPVMIRSCMKIITIDMCIEFARCIAAIMVISLKAIGDVRTPFLMVIAGALVCIGTAWFFGFYLGFGLPGIWAAYGADLLFRGCLGLYYYRKHARMHSYPILQKTI